MNTKNNIWTSTGGLTRRLILPRLAALIFLVIAACSSPNNPVGGGDNDCPLPTWGGGFGMGFIRPQCGIDHEQSISYDLKKIAYISANGHVLKILDISSRNIQIFDIESRLPSNVSLIGSGEPTWCPYDNNKLIIRVIAGTDTNYDGKGFIYGQHLYMLTLDRNEFKNINPSVFPPEGGEINIGGWLSESNPNRDVILLGWGYYPPYPQPIIGGVSKYILQEDKLEGDLQDFVITSYDGTKTITVEKRTGDPKTTILALNRKELKFSKQHMSIDKFSFSPNGKLLALSVVPDEPNWVNPKYDSTDLEVGGLPENYRFQEIWICDAEKFLNSGETVIPVKVIDIRKAFCMYNVVTSLDAIFITDTTLAVAMHPPEQGPDYCSHLWEVSITGRLIRKLTFEP